MYVRYSLFQSSLQQCVIAKIFVKEGAIKNHYQMKSRSLISTKRCLLRFVNLQAQYKGRCSICLQNNMSSSQLLEKEKVDLIKTASFAFPHKCGTCSEPINCLMMLLRSL